ncbi:MAG: hypothetical protein ACNA7W_17290 [Pseudomonadales bacterium]
MTRALVVVFALSLLAGCSEPFIVFAGGALSGEIGTPPDDWSELRGEDTFQLETRPEDPYSVNIWAVGIGPDVYIGTGPDGTTWSSHLYDDPRVRLRVGETLYLLEAHPVIAHGERRRVAAAFAEKYDMNREENWVSNAQVFRLDRR